MNAVCDATIVVAEIDLIPDSGRILLIEVVGSAEVANCHLHRSKLTLARR